MSRRPYRSSTDYLQLAIADPVAWMESCFYLPVPLCPETGKVLPPGPIRLREFQRELLRIALSRDGERFTFSTVVWSTPKKTSKTTIAAAVAYWYAFLHPYSEVILLANDGRQATDRVFTAIRRSLDLFQPAPGIEFTLNEIRFPNGSRIFPHPVNAPSAAGANPGLTVFTEVWAYTTPAKQDLWTELTPPPTVPHALQWVESYAGYLGEDSVLERLYREAQTSGETVQTRCPETQGRVMASTRARLLYYYDHGPEALIRFGWQTEDYYESQRRRLPPQEFRRIHLNEWVSHAAQALPEAWLNQCIMPDDQVAEILDRPWKGIVMGVDAGVTKAAFAIVGVTRSDDGRYILRFVHTLTPTHSTQVDFAQAENLIRSLASQHAIVEIAYDPYQLHYMAQRLREDYTAYAREFTQHSRGRADAFLLQLLQSRALIIPESLAPTIAEHYNATAWDPQSSRFATLTAQGRNDIMVALSMAVYRASQYAL